MSDFITRIDKQVQRALGLLRDGDRTPYFLRGTNTFFGGQNTPVQIAFNVPADGDFFGDCLSVFIEAREVRASGIPDAAFRPADWTTTNDVIVAAGGVQSTDIGVVSGDFELLLPEPYANTATSIGAVFSTRHGYGIFNGRQSYSVFPGKLEFFTPVFIPRGVTATLVFTPSYSLAPTPGEGAPRDYEYRVNALIEGFKKVKTLREVTT